VKICVRFAFFDGNSGDGISPNRDKSTPGTTPDILTLLNPDKAISQKIFEGIPELWRIMDVV
jgi:hypothetical protein